MGVYHTVLCKVNRCQTCGFLKGRDQMWYLDSIFKMYRIASRNKYPFGICSSNILNAWIDLMIKERLSYKEQGSLLEKFPASLKIRKKKRVCDEIGFVIVLNIESEKLPTANSDITC